MSISVFSSILIPYPCTANSPITIQMIKTTVTIFFSLLLNVFFPFPVYHVIYFSQSSYQFPLWIQSLIIPVELNIPLHFRWIFHRKLHFKSFSLIITFISCMRCIDNPMDIFHVRYNNSIPFPHNILFLKNKLFLVFHPHVSDSKFLFLLYNISMLFSM